MIGGRDASLLNKAFVREPDQTADYCPVSRVKAILEKAKSPEARCRQMAANGQPCVAHVQKYYMQRRRANDGMANRG